MSRREEIFGTEILSKIYYWTKYPIISLGLRFNLQMSL